MTDALLAPFERDVLLSTGRAMRIRPTRPADLERLRSFYERLDPASRYLRFFGQRSSMPDDELRRSTINDVGLHVALVAESGDALVGVGEYFARGGAGDEAEVAFAVADAHHHEGIATVLLEDLAMVAKAAGFRRLVAETLPDNAAMQAVFRTVGLTHRSWLDDGVVNVQLDLTADHILQDDADQRDWRAAVRSLRTIVDPAHVVVLGVEQDDSAPGRRVIAHLVESFGGRTSVVDRTVGDVDGVRTVARLDELDAVPDLAVIAGPTTTVTGFLEECGNAGVPTAVIVSPGLPDRDTDTSLSQDEILAAARRHGMRIIGPDSLGVVSTRAGLNATVTDRSFRPGGLAVASQSGGVGVAIAVEAEDRCAGISSFVSMGDKVDVSGNDLLRLWADDASTTVVLLYLESFGDPVRFARVARAVSQRKPVVALKGGRSVLERQTRRSLAATLADDQATVDALFAHTGVLRARTLEELIDVGLLLDRQPAPAGPRVALIGNGGGALLLGADAAGAGGLVVGVLSPRLQRAIAERVPPAVATTNPVDLGGGVTAEQLVDVVTLVAASGEVDGCIVVYVEIDGQHRLDTVESLLASGDHSVPLALARLGAGRHGSAALPTFSTPERAATALAVAARRSPWLASIAAEDDEPAEPDASSWVAVRRLARHHSASPDERRWLDPASSFELLEAAGVPIAPWTVVRSAADCADAATRLGPTVVLKADVSGESRKSAADAVRLGIGDASAAAKTYQEFAERFGSALRGVVVQSQQAAAVELLVGAVRDPAFGPLVVVGAGGVDAELRDDRVVLVAPVSRTAARRAIDTLRLAPLLHGGGSRPVLDIAAVVDLVHRVSLLAATTPEVEQLDLDPVLVGTSGCVAVDAVVAISAPATTITPARGLRGRPPRFVS